MELGHDAIIAGGIAAWRIYLQGIDSGEIIETVRKRAVLR
jgi:hypothetical protein